MQQHAARPACKHNLHHGPMLRMSVLRALSAAGSTTSSRPFSTSVIAAAAAKQPSEPRKRRSTRKQSPIQQDQHSAADEALLPLQPQPPQQQQQQQRQQQQQQPWLHQQQPQPQPQSQPQQQQQAQPRQQQPLEQPPQQLELVQRLVAARYELLGSRPQRFPIRGISFDDRSLVLEQLYPGDPILAVREPSNPYDPHAVMLTDMAGQQLGYVPRERAPDIQQEVTFGWLDSYGEVGRLQDMIGGHVLLHLDLAWPTIDTLPAAGWAGAEQLQEAQQSAEWKQLEASTLQASPDGVTRCAMTLLPAEEVPLVADPIWRFDALQQQVVLVGFQPVAQLVSAARKLQLGGDREQLQQAIALLMQLYGWVPQMTGPMLAYMAAVKQRMERVREEEWRLDLSLLKGRRSA